MNITKGQKKKKSIELLRKLHIYEAYIDGFRKNDYVTLRATADIGFIKTPNSKRK